MLLCGVCYFFDDSPPTKQGKQVILSSPRVNDKVINILFELLNLMFTPYFARRASSFHVDDMNARLAFDLVSGGFFRTSKYPKFECFIVSLIMSPNLNLLLDLKYQTLSVIRSPPSKTLC